MGFYCSLSPCSHLLNIKGWTHYIFNSFFDAIMHRLQLWLVLFGYNFYCWTNLHSGFSPLFVTWKKVVNGGEPRLRGCIGTLEAHCIINGFRDYALTRWFHFKIFKFVAFFFFYCTPFLRNQTWVTQIIFTSDSISLFLLAFISESNNSIMSHEKETWLLCSLICTCS